MMVATLSRRAYTIDALRDEARALVERGVVLRQQPIYMLCQHIPEREWVFFEATLEQNDFLLRDRIIDLLAQETWLED